jgi:hypothetical protein
MLQLTKLRCNTFQTSTTWKDQHYTGGGNKEQTGKRNHNNGLNLKKQQAAAIKTSNEGTNTRSRQVDDALARRTDFKNFKEENF